MNLPRSHEKGYRFLDHARQQKTSSIIPVKPYISYTVWVKMDILILPKGYDLKTKSTGAQNQNILEQLELKSNLKSKT